MAKLDLYPGDLQGTDGSLAGSLRFVVYKCRNEYKAEFRPDGRELSGIAGKPDGH